MNRRDWVKTLAVAGAVQTAKGAVPASNKVEPAIVRHKLRHTWTTTMSSSDFRDVLYLSFSSGGITGHGEGAPIVRYKENAEMARLAVESVRPLLGSADPFQFSKIMTEVFAKVEGNYAAKAAIDIALMDWVGQKLGLPLYRYFGLDAKDAPVTTFSIGIDTPEITRQKVREAEAYPILKVKVGLDKDESTMEAIRSVTKKPLRLDANEGFKSKEEAVRKINWLESLGAQFIEQPLPAHMIEESRWVRSKVHIPILADESCLHPSDVPKIADSFDGVVIKLMKTGGIMEAYKMIQVAKAFKLKTMLGCMIESSVGITAAAHLSPLVDFADLDGNLLIANDRFSGVKVVNGKLLLPNRPGLGLAP
ncbi:MAG TPA: dipeptide epimerase, partial [Bryobacteraceae bacterium]|nr:dipeptide epimerase [Bryobacteraceae bacterium]